MVVPLRQLGGVASFAGNRMNMSVGSRFDKPIRDVTRGGIQFRPNGDPKSTKKITRLSQTRSILLVSEVRLLRDTFAELLHAYCDDLFVCSMTDVSPIAPSSDRSPDLVIVHMRDKKVAESWHEDRLAEIRATYRTSPILLLSESKDSNDEERAIEAGFVGFLPATQSVAQVVAAIRLVLAGGRFHMKLTGDSNFKTNGSHNL